VRAQINPMRRQAGPRPERAAADRCAQRAIFLEGRARLRRE
jgi:hypothetical protein